MFHHYQWAAEKNRLFFGREELVESVLARIFNCSDEILVSQLLEWYIAAAG
jgi:hypothetical protein